MYKIICVIFFLSLNLGYAQYNEKQSVNDTIFSSPISVDTYTFS